MGLFALRQMTLLVITYFLTIFVIKVFNKSGLVDIPGSEPHKKHSKKTPLGGGIVIFMIFLISYILLNSYFELFNDVFLVSALVIFLTGLIDDIVKLRARFKFVVQIAVSAVLVFGGYKIDLFQIDIINWILSIAWFIGIMNGINFIDGADGIAIGVSMISFASIGLVSVIFSDQINILVVCFSFFTSLLVLYFFNRRPAKIFLGDSGSLLLGLILSLLALKFSPSALKQNISWIIPVMIFSYPIFDTSLVVYSRLSKKIPVMTSGTDHTYHRLKKRLNSHKKTEVVIFSIVGLIDIFIIGSLLIGPVYLVAAGAIIGIVMFVLLLNLSKV